MNDYYEAKCPYCGRVQMVGVNDGAMSLYECDINDKGCGKVFAYKAKIDVSIKIYKIEEE